MTFVRTVLGDIAPERLGITYAHEHLVIAGGRPVQLFPDFRLDCVERRPRSCGRRSSWGSARSSTRCRAMPAAT